MKCQSDFDTEEQAQLRQADECVEEWWDPEAKSAAIPAAETTGDSSGAEIAEAEALRRGLLRVDEEGGVCFSCPEKPTSE